MNKLDCDGYYSLLAAIERDEKRKSWHDPRAKLAWAVDRARHYAEKTGLKAEDILDAWEQHRNYWFQNYYQDANQPMIESDRVRVIDTIDELQMIMGDKFRCPMCKGVSRSPYACDSGDEMEPGKTCDWKVGGLFGDLGKGIHVFVKSKMRGETIFMPIAWERDEL